MQIAKAEMVLLMVTSQFKKVMAKFFSLLKKKREGKRRSELFKPPFWCEQSGRDQPHT